MKKVLFTATVDSHIMQFHIPYLKYFKENGYKVHVATNGNEEIPYCDKKFHISFERKPFRFNNLRAIKKLKKVINEEKYDIIHTHTPMGSVVTRISAIKARKIYNTRVIYTAHGFHFFNGAPLTNWLFFYSMEKYLSKYTDTLITINKEDYNLAKEKFHCKDVYLIHGIGADSNKFKIKYNKKQKSIYRKTLGINDKDYVIIYAAELIKRKNQGMLIKAIKLLVEKGVTDIKVLLPGFDSLNGYYQRFAKKLGIEDYIYFLGYRKDIENLMNISDLVVSTSKQEGLPLHLVEGMLCDLPCIATIDRGHKELIKDGYNGYLIKQDDYIELANKILCLKNNINIAEKFINNSKLIVGDYLIENTMKEMINIYKINSKDN